MRWKFPLVFCYWIPSLLIPPVASSVASCTNDETTSPGTNSFSGAAFFAWPNLFRPPGPLWTLLFRRRFAAPSQFCLYSRNLEGPSLSKIKALGCVPLPARVPAPWRVGAILEMVLGRLVINYPHAIEQVSSEREFIKDTRPKINTTRRGWSAPPYSYPLTAKA